MFRYRTFYLSHVEYAKINGEINACYYDKYVDKKFAIHKSVGVDNKYYWYYFEIQDFDDYNIYMRIEVQERKQI